MTWTVEVNPGPDHNDGVSFNIQFMLDGVQQFVRRINLIYGPEREYIFTEMVNLEGRPIKVADNPRVTELAPKPKKTKDV